MASLGDLGVHRPEPPTEEVKVEPDTFQWFGSTIRVSADMSEMELMDFIESIDGIDSQGLMALRAIKRGLQMVIEPDDFDLFWRLGKDNIPHGEGIDTLSSVMMLLVFGETGRPSEQQSDSSDGLLPTPESSPGDSPSEASPGRPDLQLLRDDAAADKARIMRQALAAG